MQTLLQGRLDLEGSPSSEPRWTIRYLICTHSFVTGLGLRLCFGQTKLGSRTSAGLSMPFSLILRVVFFSSNLNLNDVFLVAGRSRRAGARQWRSARTPST